MSHDKKMTAASVLGACALILLWVESCKPPMTSTSATVWPTSPDCCTDLPRFPPLCDILPGQSTIEDVEQVLGPPVQQEIVHPEDGRHVPAIAGVDMRWSYTFECPVIVWFGNGTVTVVQYDTLYMMDLQDAVALYGSPDKVHLDWCYPVEEEPGGYYCVDFLWLAEGVVIGTELREPIEQPLALAPFRPDLPIGRVWYFQPTSLGHIFRTYDDVGVTVEWPGMIHYPTEDADRVSPGS